jgi:hypothetical protein
MEDNGRMRLDFAIDGQRMSGEATGGINQVVNSQSGLAEPGAISWIVNPPAGVHTFSVQWASPRGVLTDLNVAG